MSEQKSREAPPSFKLDQWGLKPVRPGSLRGWVKNFRQTETLCPYGQLLILDFELDIGPALPMVPVRITGTAFDGRIANWSLLDVPDPDPTVRPVTPWRVIFADSGLEMIAYYPGRSPLAAPYAFARKIITIAAYFGVAISILIVIGFYLERL